MGNKDIRREKKKPKQTKDKAKPGAAAKPFSLKPQK
jgi:hypothetical protein